MLLSAVKMEYDTKQSNGTCLRLHPLQQRVCHAREQEQQRLQHLYGKVQFHAFNQALLEARLYREHQVWPRPTSERMQSLSRLPDTRNQISHRECGQLPAGVNTPRLKCLFLLRREVQHTQRKIPH